MANSWDPVLLPPGYAYGFTGGPAFDTRYIKMDGGGQQRVQVVEEPIWRWSALRKNFRNGADVNGLRDFFLARRGGLYGFLFLDPADSSTAPDGRAAPLPTDQLIGFGDGATRRFKLRKQYSDPGGMTARTFVRRVIPMLGTADPAVARIIGVDAGDDISPQASVDGVTDSGAVFLPMSLEVELAAAPAIGQEVRWGGYFVTPVGFADSTDKGFEATMAGFMADEASFDVESLPFDDPVPLVPGGSPYGAVVHSAATANIELSGRAAFLHEVEANAAISGYLDDLDNYPTGGPHLFIVNTGPSTMTVRDSLGSSIGTVSSGGRVWLFVKEDAAGNRTPVLF